MQELEEALEGCSIKDLEGFNQSRLKMWAGTDK